MNYTSIEQSKKLLELGLNSDSADMYWMHGQSNNIKQHSTPNIIGNDNDEPVWNVDLPCWSVGALLDIIPQGILRTPYIGEKNYLCTSTHSDVIDEEFYGHSSIDACYEMVVWLLENGYIKKVQNNDKD